MEENKKPELDYKSKIQQSLSKWDTERKIKNSTSVIDQDKESTISKRKSFISQPELNPKARREARQVSMTHSTRQEIFRINRLKRKIQFLEDPLKKGEGDKEMSNQENAGIWENIVNKLGFEPDFEINQLHKSWKNLSDFTQQKPEHKEIQEILDIVL